jgi:aminopeptidase N
MSEGFAEFSASLYVQKALSEDDYFQFWKSQHRLLTERDAEGFRSIDVGPLMMGTRLSSAKAGFETYRDLIYPKGAYVLHMLRMMMWTPQDKDDQFIATMHDFLETFRNKSASTEDFQHIVEKHMSPGMNLTHNGKMDWFFDEWVRGTAIPQYDFRYTLDRDKDGTVLLWLRIQQSNVSDDFQMLVPVYLETSNGQYAKLVEVAVKGNNFREGRLRLGKLDAMPKRALINYQYDVLCTP